MNGCANIQKRNREPMTKRLAHTMKTLLAGRRGQRGETLAEVLVAVAIGALALIMMAMAISVSSHIAGESRENMTDYFEASNAIVAARATSSDDKGEITLSDGSAVALVDETAISVSYYTNSAASSVIVYEKDTPSGGGAG